MSKYFKKFRNTLSVAIPTITIPTTVGGDPKTWVVAIIDYALWFLGAIALVFAIYGGVLYITSGGDSDKTTKARNTLMYAVLGVIVIVVSYTLIHWAVVAPTQTLK